MVHVSAMLLGLAATFMVDAEPTSVSDDLPPFEVPTFDYLKITTNNTPNDVLNAIMKNGIVGFKNVSLYPQKRLSYLNLAAHCAVSAQEANAKFLLQKTLVDGTKRYTISSTSGQNPDASAAQTDVMCPGYKNVYDEFSSLLEMVVLTVATTLDATTFTTKDGYGQTISSRKLMTDAVRLDHFHAYETPSLHDRRLQSASSISQSSSDLSLELHTDDGMFIVFAVPSFYQVGHDGSNHTLEPVPVGHADTGLIIQLQDGQRVRPILNPDYIYLMPGAGYNKWVEPSERIPEVLHAMRMPEIETTATQRLLRAWFGKMTLLPSYQRMLKQIDFAEHRNLTAQYVFEGQQTDLPQLGCGPNRRLVASADTCTFRSCTTIPNAIVPDGGCAVVCNRNHGGDADACNNACTCSQGSHAGTVCWMLCVEDLTSCSLQDQSCSGQTKVCTPAPVTPPTPPPAPVTPAPVPVPVAPAPVPVPVAPAPVPVPIAPAPVPVPIAPAPVPVPVAPAPVPVPVAPAPVPVPVAPAPVSSPVPTFTPTPPLAAPTAPTPAQTPSTPSGPTTPTSNPTAPLNPSTPPSMTPLSNPSTPPSNNTPTDSSQDRDSSTDQSSPENTPIASTGSPTPPTSGGHSMC